MASIKIRGQLWLLAGICVVFFPGCIMINSEIKLNTDGSTDIDMQLGINKTIMEMSDDTEVPFDDMKEGLPESWIAEPFSDEKWTGIKLKGHAVPGEKILPPTAENSGSNMGVVLEKHLLCTDYIFNAFISSNGPIPNDDPDSLENTASIADSRVIFTQYDIEDEATEEEDYGWDEDMGDVGMEDMEMPDMSEFGADIGALFSGISDSASLTFTVSAPGKILTTDEKAVITGNKATWIFTVNDFMSDTASLGYNMHLSSRLLNWQNIGRLSDLLADKHGMFDVAGKIAEYTLQGLLPNPPRDDPQKGTFDVDAYAAAITVISTLEEQLGKPIAAKLVNKIGMNRDGITGRELRLLAEKFIDMPPDKLQDLVVNGLADSLKPDK